MNNNEGDNFLEDYDLLNDEPYPEGNEYQDTILAEVLTNNVQIDKKPNKMTKFYKAPEIKEVKKQSFNKMRLHWFFQGLMNQPYKAEVLVNIFNRVVKPINPITAQSFGQLKFVKENFTKTRKKRNGKIKTFYTKINKQI